jgi:uncharacterized protein (DUF58 family)
MAETLLDPVLVAKISTMELRARYVVEGALAGRHRSLHQGHSLEFVGHRAYSPSDEWRHIDWKVYAKTDRWVVREQQEETNLRATLLVDTSRSMAFAGPGRLPKIRYAAILSAALAYLLVHRRESVGLGLFGEALRSFVPARGGAPHLSYVLDQLDQVSPDGPTNLPAALQEAGQRLPRRGLVFILSDFLSAPETILPAVRALLARKHEVVAFQILDPGERDLPFDGEFVFEDLETGEKIRAHAGEIRDIYRRLINDRLEKLRRMFASLGVDSYLFDTAVPLETGLSLFLQRRLAR